MATKVPSAQLLLRYDDLHEELQLSRSLFTAGHYQEALRKSAERFQNRVRDMAGYQGNKTGRAMLRQIFEGRPPLLLITTSAGSHVNSDYSEGFVNLAVGMTAGVRNVSTHADDWVIGHDRAMELLALISALHYTLDEAVPYDIAERPTRMS